MVEKLELSVLKKVLLLVLSYAIKCPQYKGLMMWSLRVLVRIILEGQLWLSRKSVMTMNSYSLLLIQTLLWCTKLVAAPCLGDRNELRTEHQSFKCASKCCWRKLGDKKTWDNLYCSQVQGYDIHAWNVLFCVDCTQVLVISWVLPVFFPKLPE